MSQFSREFHQWYSRVSGSIHEFVKDHGFKPTDQQKWLLDSLDDNDCVYLLPFQDVVGPGVWGAPDDAAVRGAVRGYPYGWSTKLYDAIRAAHAALDARAPDYSFISPPVAPISGCGYPLGPDEVMRFCLPPKR